MKVAKLLKCRTFDSHNAYDIIAEVPTLQHGNVHFFVPMPMSRMGGIMVDVIEEREKTSLIAVSGDPCSSEPFPNLFTVLNTHLRESK